MVPQVHRFAHLDKSPDILLLHVGGNDMGVRSMRELSRNVKFDFVAAPHCVSWYDYCVDRYGGQDILTFGQVGGKGQQGLQ